jgi:hypothetical protein
MFSTSVLIVSGLITGNPWTKDATKFDVSVLIVSGELISSPNVENTTSLFILNLRFLFTTAKGSLCPFCEVEKLTDNNTIETKKTKYKIKDSRAD